MTASDVARADKIYGKDIHALKGKQTGLSRNQWWKIIWSCLKVSWKTTKILLSALTSCLSTKFRSRHIKFTTVEVIQKRKKFQLSECIKNVIAIYTQRGFKVQHALLDGKFVPLRTDLLNMGIHANCATQNEHVPEIERQNRVIKERARACRSTLPFEVLPQLLLVKMVNNCVPWINMFPAKGGISSVSPMTLMTRIKLDYSKHCR